jgi:hypothetical protein
MLIDAATLRKAEALIESCEHRNPEGAEIPFDNILDWVTGSDPSVTDYRRRARRGPAVHSFLTKILSSIKNKISAGISVPTLNSR